MTDQFYTLITGASEGLGKAFAIECAKRKMNLILVALPGIELQNLAESLRSNYGIQVIPFEKDLCEENSCREIFNEVSNHGYRVNILLNNAGTGSTGSFADGDIQLFERQIKLNVLATTMITRLFIETLIQNSPSYVLNVGSLASYFPLPKKQVYGATKSFIFYFSKCLRQELKKNKVYISVLCPGPIKTNRSVCSVIENGNVFIRNSSFYPENVAAIALDGLFKRKKVMVPGKLNNCYILVYSLLPEFIKSIITNHSMKKLNSSTASPAILQNALLPASTKTGKSGYTKA
jgi:uncharacterized protein